MYLVFINYRNCEFWMLDFNVNVNMSLSTVQMLEKYQKMLKQRNNHSKSSTAEKSLSIENNMDRDQSVDLSKV